MMNLSRVTGLHPPRMPEPSDQLVLPHCHVGVEIEVEGTELSIVIEVIQLYGRLNVMVLYVTMD